MIIEISSKSITEFLGGKKREMHVCIKLWVILMKQKEEVFLLVVLVYKKPFL